jgi:hypothetical protein
MIYLDLSRVKFIFCFSDLDTLHHAIKKSTPPIQNQIEKKSERYVFIVVASNYKITIYNSRIENPADDSVEVQLAT